MEDERVVVPRDVPESRAGKFLCVVKQWLQESMEWKECVAGSHGTFEEARYQANNLRVVGCQAYVANEESAK